jgi:hypothetical protein
MKIQPVLAHHLGGYEPQFAMRRLSYGSFVSLRHRYMYVETPKAACTSIKHMLIALEGAEYDPAALPYHRETRRDMLIHQRRHVGIPNLLEVDAGIREEILSGTAGWFVFAVSRNPFSRLVSVFENKVRTGEPRYRQLEARYGDRGAFADPKAAFSAFVREIICDDERRTGDPHFTGQSELLVPRIIPYTHVFKLESIGAMMNAFRAHLRAQGAAVPIGLRKENAGMGVSWRDYYDCESAAAVATSYAEDFRAYEYDIDSWRGGQRSISESEAYRRWRAELVERNAFIDRMFDWMDELRRA